MLARTIHRQDKTTGLTWMELVGPRLSRYEAGTGAARLLRVRLDAGLPARRGPREREGARGLLHRTREQDVPPDRRQRSASASFPVWADRYVSAHTATLKHLSPVKKEEQWRQRVAADWNDLAPAVGVVGTVATDVAGLAPIGSVAKVAGANGSPLEHARSLYSLGGTIRRNGRRADARAPASHRPTRR